MVNLQMSEEEGKLLLGVLETYQSHLAVEIHRTFRREFREALQERDAALSKIILKLKGLTKAG